MDPGDCSFVLVSAALVTAMAVPGLAQFYRGLHPDPSEVSTHVVVLTLSAVVAWVTIGYWVAFGQPLFLALPNDRVGGLPLAAHGAFHAAFAAVAAALLAGVTASRISPSGLVRFSVVWVAAVYAPVAWALWSPSGILSGVVLDYAGGLAVHVLAGASSLAICLLLPSRAGHSVGSGPWTTYSGDVLSGGGLLVPCWIGFNAGSALAADGRAGLAAVVSLAAAAGGALAWGWRSGWERPSELVFGAVAGLVAVTPASGFVTPLSGLGIGLLAGLLCRPLSELLSSRIGDPCDCVAVHGGGGALGSVLVGFLGTREVAGGGPLGVVDLAAPEMVREVGQHLLFQVGGTAAAAAWGFVATALLLLPLRRGGAEEVP